MAGPEDETRVMPGRMAGPVFGPDYASPHEEGRARPIGPWGAMPGPAGDHRLLTETKGLAGTYRRTVVGRPQRTAPHDDDPRR
jgi:hypothetical protein